MGLFSFFTSLFAPTRNIPASIYDFRIQALDGGTINMADHKGKKILIVNTASYCGHTPQYEQLEALYRKYKDRLTIIGFPANNFLFQEPGSDNKIKHFCTEHYDITFPMASKISVRGRNTAPIYLWLTMKKYNNHADSKVKWNFQKYLINETGQLTGIFDPKTKPDSAEIIQAIEQ